MIVETDRGLVDALKVAARDVAGTFDEIKWIMDNVSWHMTNTMKDMDKRIWFHDFYGLRVVTRAITYGFVQVNEGNVTVITRIQDAQVCADKRRTHRFGTQNQAKLVKNQMKNHLCSL